MFKKLCDENKVYRNLFNGQWIESDSGNFIEIYSPVNNILIGKIQAMSKQEVNESIKNTKTNLKIWSQTPIYERAEILYKAAKLLKKREEFISDILVMEIAKDKKSALSEIQRSYDFINFTADIAKSMEGQAISGENFPGGSKNKLSYVSRVALGTVLAISPFNYPINLSVSKIAPALVGGNAVLLKPPTQGAISTLHLAEVFNKAGLPKGIINTVTGKGNDIGDYIVAHEDINFINFTGSTEVGKHISKIAGMVPMLLELGGKDAAIVLDDIDVDFAAKNIVSGAYSYSGQRCTAVKRIIVMDKIADKLIEKLKPQIESLTVGDPREGADIVPLINEKSADFVQFLIDEAVKMGAKVITGNKRKNNLIYPTLLDKVTKDMKIAWEEPFGPVLPIIRVKSIEEAIDITNHSEYGLQSSVFTNDINKAFYISNKLEVGTVQINNKTERGPDHFPFLGVKSSGMGTQGVKYSIEAMTRPKAIIVNLNEANC